MQLTWKCFDLTTIDVALAQSFCLYVFHHKQDGDRPFYIGKAKYFGTKQPSGYKDSARYNSGYVYLLDGMLRSGFTLYIASIGETAYRDAEDYEQELIAQWNPLKNQKTKSVRKAVTTTKPWNNS